MKVSRFRSVQLLAVFAASVTLRDCARAADAPKYLFHPPLRAANDLVGDPKFAAYGKEPSAKNDYRLQQGSAAIGKGIVLPEELQDPLRPEGGARPDIGAIPLGGDLKFGRQGRNSFPITGSPRSP